MKKQIKIGLIPSDFIGNHFSDREDCALARATKRHFKAKNITCGSWTLTIYNTFSYDFFKQRFDIVDGFGFLDYEYVKEQYEKDPKMKEVQYEITLIEKPKL